MDDANFDRDGESEKGVEESNEYGGNLNGGDNDRLRSEKRDSPWELLNHKGGRE